MDKLRIRSTRDNVEHGVVFERKYKRGPNGQAKNKKYERLRDTYCTKLVTQLEKKLNF